MPNTTTGKMSHFEEAMAELDMAITTGKVSDPLIREYWLHGLLPGPHGDKARGILDNFLTGPSVLARLSHPAEPPEPALDLRQTVFVGRRRSPKQMTGILLRAMTTHLLIQGPSGYGKTNLIWFIIRQLLDFRVKVVFHDHKNEGRKLIRHYPGVVVLGVSDFRENFLRPVGNPKHYYTTFWSEFARAYRVRRETMVKLIAISLRILAGLKPGEPHPSLYDFACILRRMAVSERDSTLDTAATAIEAANATLGECAMVREGPHAEDLFQVVVIQCHGLPPEFLQFFMGIRLLRTHVLAIEKGHSGDLVMAIVSDEGGIEFAKELSSDSSSGFITPQKKMITQLRSAGIGIVIGAQSISAIDPAVTANVGSFMCLRAQTDPDVRLSGRLLGRPDDRLDELRRIPRWSGLFKSPDHTGDVLVDIPEVDMGNYLSDADLATMNKPALDRLNAQAIFSPTRNDAANPILYREILGESLHPDDQPRGRETAFDMRDEHIRFIQDVVAHPNASVVEHYNNLGWSAGRGTRVKTDLLENGILVSERQTSSNGRPVERLSVTTKGKELFNDLEVQPRP